jgi:hypothetical protein
MADVARPLVAEERDRGAGGKLERSSLEPPAGIGEERRSQQRDVARPIA